MAISTHTLARSGDREDLLVGADRLTKDKVSAGHTAGDRRADLVEAELWLIGRRA